MEGVRVDSAVIGTFSNQQQALDAARRHAGDEVVVHTANGYELHAATFDSPAARQRYLDDATAAHTHATVADGTNVVAVSFETPAPARSRVHGAAELTVVNVDQASAALLARIPTMSAADGIAALQTLITQAKTDHHLTPAETDGINAVANALRQKITAGLTEIYTQRPGESAEAFATRSQQGQAAVDQQTASLEACVADLNHYNDDQNMAGSRVVNGQYENPAAILADLSQMDSGVNYATASSRCGAQNLLAALIRRGPAALEQAVQWLRSQGQALPNVNVSDGLTRAELSAISGAIYAEGRERVPAQYRRSEGLSDRELGQLAQGMGLGSVSGQRVLSADVDLSHMAVGETIAFNIAPEGNHGQEGHWISVTRTAEGWQIYNPMGSTASRVETLDASSTGTPALQSFTSDSAAEAYIQSHFPTHMSDGTRARRGILTMRIPAPPAPPPAAAAPAATPATPPATPPAAPPAAPPATPPAVPH